MKNKKNASKNAKKANENSTWISNFVDKLEVFLQKIFKCKWLYYVLLFIAAFYLYHKGMIKKLENVADSHKYINYFYIGSVIICAVLFILLFFNNKFKKMCIEKKYLIFALVLGFTYLVISPVFTQSDESFHFLRAYQVSEGHFISPYDAEGRSYDDFPSSLYKVLWDDDDRFPEYKNYDDSFNESKVKLDKNKTVRKDVRADGYIFLNYLPQAFGINIAKFFNLSPYYLGLFGRLFNMIICTVIMYIGIKALPILKRTFSLILLAPTSIAYIASMSADGLVIAMSFLLIAFVIKYIYEKSKLGWKQYIWLLIIIAFVSTCKVSYLPIIGILIFLPYECFKNKKIKWIYCLSLILLGIIFSISWIRLVSINIVRDVPGTGISKYSNFMYVYINTMFNNLVGYNENMFAGYFLYQCRVSPFTFIPIIYAFIIYLSCVSEKNTLELRYISKFVISMIALLIVTLIAYALYSSNTEAGATLINGIQGRYFIPVLLLIPLLLGKCKNEADEIKIFDISLLMNMLVLFSMLRIFVY